LEAFESLAAVDTVMFDKTGTLTQDAMSLSQVHVRVGSTEQDALAMAGALARHSLHPASKSIWDAAKQATGESKWQVSDVVEQAGKGVSAKLSWPDHPENDTVLHLGSASFCGLVSKETSILTVYMSDEQGWLASFELQEIVRPDAAQTIAGLQSLGMSMHLLSGDASEAAKRVAQKVGIQDVKGQCSPQDKLEFLRESQIKGQKVAVVGDGLNDGPVLAGAHASFAFGQAVPLAQAMADFLVSGTRLRDVLDTVVLSRRTLKIVRQNLWWAAFYNVVCVPLAVVGWLPAWLAGLGMASSSLLVVLNALRLSSVTQFSQED
jgi:Cu2+-exporting ATPase